MKVSRTTIKTKHQQKASCLKKGDLLIRFKNKERKYIRKLQIDLANKTYILAKECLEPLRAFQEEPHQIKRSFLLDKET